MSRIVFVNRFYSPDLSATAQMLSSLAESLAREGFDVHVICSRIRYDDPEHKLPRFEKVNGVKVRRVWSSAFGRGSIAGRAADYFTFYLSLLFVLLATLRKGETVVAKTDPPMLSVLVALIARIRGARLINWLQDLFPEVARAAGMSRNESWVWRRLVALRNWSLNCAAYNVAIGEKMRELLHENRVSDSRIKVIPNWSLIDQDALPLSGEHPLRREWGLTDKFVVAYSGNLGMAHDCELMLATIRAMAEDSSVCFLLIGGGSGMDMLKHKVAHEQLDNVQFRPYQPLDLLHLSLSVADVHWVSLKPEMEGLIVPSKLYGVLAVKRPVLFVGDADGEVARLLEKYNCGQTVSDNQPASIVRAIRYLQHDRNGYFDSNLAAAYSPAASHNKWRDLLLEKAR